MAEKAAHITSTTHPKPSIFEVTAQDSLNVTVHPALRHLLTFLASCQPRKFGWLVEFCDELYLGLTGYIQYYFLKKYDASFSELFYGLKRMPMKGNKSELSDRQRYVSLLHLVLLPYLGIKLEQRLSTYRLQLADGILQDDWEKKTKQICSTVQSVTQLITQLWSTVQYVRYMSGHSQYQSIALQLQGLSLACRPDAGGFGSSWLAVVLELAAFGAQFTRVWRREDAVAGRLPSPPPPSYERRAERYRGMCPICMKPWKVPVVLTVSGYIYCYHCITSHFQNKAHTCHVTSLPANTKHIVRLFKN